MDLYRFDEAYLDRLRSADADTEEHFGTYFGRMLTLKLRSKLNSKESIEDIKQETLFRVLKTISTVREPEKLGAYVNTTCNYVLLEYYRASKRESPLEEEKYDPPDTKVNLEAAASASQTKEKVRLALRRLEPKDRDILTALFIEEQDKEKICKRFGVDRDYLRVLLYRAKAQFRAVWKTGTAGAD